MDKPYAIMKISLTWGKDLFRPGRSRNLQGPPVTFLQHLRDQGDEKLQHRKSLILNSHPVFPLGWLTINPVAERLCEKEVLKLSATHPALHMKEFHR